MFMRWIMGACALSLLPGCTSTNLRQALGTPKNPVSVFATPPKRPVSPLVPPLFKILMEADTLSTSVPDTMMRRYVAAGFALSDVYCSTFFQRADETARRRRFGRALTNDVGTAVQSVLNLAKTGANIVTGAGVAAGLADSMWRNYDDSFMVSPDLSNVQTLVFAAQDNFRARTLATKAKLPDEYATAQTIILRYANFCSNLGMKSLLNASADTNRAALDGQTNATNRTGDPDAAPTTRTDPAAAAAPTGQNGTASGSTMVTNASPTIAPNR